ncbi:hypothetical protein Prudu_004660, partial [Prunus dulcis]
MWDLSFILWFKSGPMAYVFCGNFTPCPKPSNFNPHFHYSF